MDNYSLETSRLLQESRDRLLSSTIVKPVEQEASLGKTLNMLHQKGIIPPEATEEF